VAHVLWAVHRRRVFFSGTLKPPAEIAFDSGARATSIPGVVQHDLVFNSHHTSADFADFLANPSPLRKGHGILRPAAMLGVRQRNSYNRLRRENRSAKGTASNVARTENAGRRTTVSFRTATEGGCVAPNTPIGPKKPSARPFARFSCMPEANL